jgi:iron complex transport system ATP-binding protein
MGSSIKDMLGGVSSKDKEAVNRYIEKMGLVDIRDKSISELSGGQLERVLLARTFAQETPIILLDEPTNHLDIRYQSELIDYMKEWSDGHTEVDGISYKNTIISVFHDIETAAYLSDEIMLMKDGNVIKKGPTMEALDKNLLEEVYETDVLGFLRKISSGKIFSQDI